jgi:hypothetical protein
LEEKFENANVKVWMQSISDFLGYERFGKEELKFTIWSERHVSVF